MDDKLTKKEKMEITIQSGLQLIPYIGGALSTLYFGTKQEKKFKRIESFYQEFASQIKQLQLQLPPVQIHDPDQLSALIEELNEKVEREHTEQKRTYLKRYLLSTLSLPTNNLNFDERRFFLDLLNNMTLLECDLLVFLYQHKQPLRVGNINKPGVNQYAIVGAIGRLKMYGLLRSLTTTLNIGGGRDNALEENVSLSDYGIRFIHYCLE